MSDKQKQRIANDPIRALKYGNQLAGFSDDFNKSWLKTYYKLGFQPIRAKIRSEFFQPRKAC